MRKNRNKSKCCCIHCGYLAMGGVGSMLFCWVSSSPLTMFILGLFLVVVAFAIAFGRKLEKERIFPWWW